MAQIFQVNDLQVGPRDNQVMNRYFLWNPDAINKTAQQVATAYWVDHGDLVRFIQGNEYRHVAIGVQELVTGNDSFLLTLLNASGLRVGDSMTAFSAYSFPCRATGPTVKKGGKRIPGIREVDSNDDVVEDTGLLALLAGIALSLFLPFDVAGTPFYNAAVRYIPVNNSAIVAPIIAAIYRQVGSQVSRKLSRGGGTSLGSFVPAGTAEMNNSAYAQLTNDAETLDEMETKRSNRTGYPSPSTLSEVTVTA